ncbi:type II toxin-antitoxin system VapC family toxin [Microlunatus elymi]|uniref:Ribonuclease VapC n=1 Tax=Microlunatus elymi TaxID=2596828 RepID=A0A516Q3Z2_9ACTN|nr:type II toxin-antitoxin system VapC family toxin [Microlunatus elymi]QDP98092.1 type II toxin-antitoxin system VapC family toxin [Microlunatus elymi]
MIILDTSVLIDHLRGVADARRAMTSAVERGDLLAASVLTKVEVLAGMRAGEETQTRILLDSLRWVEVTDAIAERAGALAGHFLRSHPGVDPVDYVIAATAQQLNARLWTMNLKHFPMFGDLQHPY